MRKTKMGYGAAGLALALALAAAPPAAAGQATTRDNDVWCKAEQFLDDVEVAAELSPSAGSAAYSRYARIGLCGPLPAGTVLLFEADQARRMPYARVTFRGAPGMVWVYAVRIVGPAWMD